MVEQADEFQGYDHYDATYSPEDNKLRFYSLVRVATEDYRRLKAAGFRWAPKQQLFVAPQWTPEREDVLIELCGEIGDEGTSCEERALMRSERFGGYKEKRAQDAEMAHAAVQETCDQIPMGQPILVGHHSEARARKQQEKIETGMRKAVKMWRTSEYWERRAKGVISHANYVDRADVRARRVKKLEADLRKWQRSKKGAEAFADRWTNADTKESAQRIANYFMGDVKVDGESMSAWSALDRGLLDYREVASQSVERLARAVEHYDRWIDQISLRIDYEKAILEAQGAAYLLKPPKRPKQPPLLNYRAEGGMVTLEHQYHKGEFYKVKQVDMTKAEWKKIYHESKGTRLIEGSHRVRIWTGLRLMDAHEAVFLTDSKVHKKPAPEVIPEPALPVAIPSTTRYVPPEPTKFDAMEESLKKGVTVVSAPQLFPTPMGIAEEMAEALNVQSGMRVLEPSAGTGNLLRALPANCESVAVEINGPLSAALVAHDDRWPHLQTTWVSQDFLKCAPGSAGTFDRVIMNPPFENGADIKHIKHALTFLKPEGRLVALCANGPRQQQAFKGAAKTWKKLPAGSFKSAGTNVNVVMLTIEKCR
ncbi:DUF3560 domain-containing protein [bacterium]|nr:DUF3560 domain-containing protein [bacterium]